MNWLELSISFVLGFATPFLIWGFIIPDKIAKKQLSWVAERRNISKISMPLGIVIFLVVVGFAFTVVVPAIMPVLNNIHVGWLAWALLAVATVLVVASTVVLIFEKSRGEKPRSRSVKQTGPKAKEQK
jgi:asparagine N-glycosylation enzyme membrane subunit Stt3